tara:strand:+ start:115191 stop:116051 length:861 start_codon:yes stop_codon:yes gene_type:complete
MNNKFVSLLLVLVIVVAGLYWAFGLPRVGNPEIPTSVEAIARGEYLYNAAGCGACHQVDGAAGPIGGYEIESPFGGHFITPNITPDEETGIGGWSGRDFVLAIKHGRSPGGNFYWPAFPYRSYQGLSDEEVLDIAAYMVTLPPVNSQAPDHELPAWQFSWMMSGWNIMADMLEGDLPAIGDDPQVQRGAHLARHLSHCGECHTPRNALGISDLSNEFGGQEGVASAALTSEGLSAYSYEDFVYFLEDGFTANFEQVGGEMMDVIDHTSKLTQEDREALAAFLFRVE